MIKNVNLLQNPIEYDKYIEDFLIQALANLGQRVGIKGDGISYQYFTFNDLIGDNKIYDATKHLGFIQYIKDNTSKYKATFGVCNVDTETNVLSNDKILFDSENINNTLYFPNDLTFDIPVGGIEKYSKNSICINNGKDLTFMLAGKLIGTNDTDPLNTILYYYKFDINSNLLKYGAKIYHYKTDERGDWFCLIITVNTDYENNNYTDDTLSSEYKMNIYIFNADASFKLYDDVKSSSYIKEFKNTFCFNSYKETNDIPFSLIKPEYEQISELLNYNGETNNVIDKFDSNSPIAIIKNLPTSSLYHSQSFKLDYNINKNEFISINDDNYINIVNYYRNEFDLSLDQEISLLNEDTLTLYYNIFNYYNEKYYLSSRSEFIKRILIKLYEKISADVIEPNINNEILYKFRLYIPLNYQFHYICNSNNNMYIYYSTNTYVNFTNLSTSKFNWENNNCLIFAYDKDIDKVKAYNFEINYNINDETLINSIAITDIYTMPYINAENNWNINENDTSIQATGKDAGNPNIIVIYNKDKQNNSEESYKILNVISKADKLGGTEFEQEWFNVDKLLFENSISLNNIKCCAYIPKVTNDNIDALCNSIILSISELQCLENDSLINLYKGAYILTMWYFDSDANTMQFKCIYNGDSALALGSTVNPASITGSLSSNNLDEKDLLVIKAVITEIAQNRLESSSLNWLILKNKQSEDYKNENNSNTNISQYNNDLNMIIQYSDNIGINNSNYGSLTKNNSKYISSLKDVKITNSLYPKYGINSVVLSNKTVNDTIEYIKESADKYVQGISQSVITVNGNEITNVDSFIEVLKNKYVNVNEEINETIKIRALDRSNVTNYNEYVFNTNVPTIDYKEVFNRNFNLLNRLNIVSLSSSGKIYNAYIGSSYDETDKNTLHIGTTKTNINLGNDSLIDEVLMSDFNKHQAISIDFDEIILNATNKLSSKLSLINTVTLNNTKYCTFNKYIIGRYDPSSLVNDNALFTHINMIGVGTNTQSLFEPYVLNFTTFIKSLLSYNINSLGTNINFIKECVVILTERSSNSEDIVYNKPIYYKMYNNNLYILFMKNNVDMFMLENQRYIIYIPNLLNVMYFESLDNDNNKLLNIYLSFNKNN